VPTEVSKHDARFQVGMGKLSTVDYGSVSVQFVFSLASVRSLSRQVGQTVITTEGTAVRRAAGCDGQPMIFCLFAVQGVVCRRVCV
jgi:hypothetical protein